MHFVSKDADLLRRTVSAVEGLAELGRAGAVPWVFRSVMFTSQFVSPALECDGKKRRPRPGTTYGFSKNAV